MPKSETIRVRATGDAISLVHEVGPQPLKEIGDRPVTVYRRSGVVQRLLKAGEIAEVAKKAEPPKSDKGADKGK